VSIEIFTQIRLQIRLRTLELGVQGITLKPPAPAAHIKVRSVVVYLYHVSLHSCLTLGLCDQLYEVGESVQ
jgi:hypothetical protein